MLLDNLKAALLWAEAGILVFAAFYTAWTLPKRTRQLRTLRARIAAEGGWWHNPAGLTMVLEAACLLIFFVLLSIAGFWKLSPYVDILLSWVEVGLIYATGAIFFWRTIAFGKIHRARLRTGSGSPAAPEAAPTEEQG